MIHRKWYYDVKKAYVVSRNSCSDKPTSFHLISKPETDTRYTLPKCRLGTRLSKTQLFFFQIERTQTVNWQPCLVSSHLEAAIVADLWPHTWCGWGRAGSFSGGWRWRGRWLGRVGWWGRRWLGWACTTTWHTWWAACWATWGCRGRRLPTRTRRCRATRWPQTPTPSTARSAGGEQEASHLRHSSS